MTDVTRYRDPGHFAVGARLVRRNRKPSQLDREAGLVMGEGAKGREIASGAPSLNWGAQATGGIRTVGAAEQAIREMAIEDVGSPFGSRRVPERGAESLGAIGTAARARVDVRPSAGELTKHHFRTVGGHGLLIESPLKSL